MSDDKLDMSDLDDICARCGCFKAAHGEGLRCEPVGWTFTLEADEQSERASMEGEIERLPDDEAASLRIIQKAFGDAGIARPFFGEAYEPGTVIASIVRQVAALTSSKTGDE